MNSMPPREDPTDDIDEAYRRWSVADTHRPDASVQRAVFAQAASLARTRSASAPPRYSHQRRHTMRRAALTGGLAAAALAGLIVTPRFFRSEPITAKHTARSTGNDGQTEHVQPAPPSAPTPVPQALQEPAAAQRAAAPPITSNQDNTVLAEHKTSTKKSATRAEEIDRNAELRQLASVGDVAGVTAMLQGHMELESRDSIGRTALMLAVTNGRADTVFVLLAHGADPNVADTDGTTALQVALASNYPVIADALRRAGAR